MRKLASIQRIVSLTPIEGKDRIELAQVLGWRVIVQKGLYQVGDLCVYCEPDSLMPEKPEFEFLRPKKFKIRIMKMSGVLSEGICFPLSILPQGTWEKEGLDVTDTLGVKHVDEATYLPPEPKQATKTSGIANLMMLLPPLRPLARWLTKRDVEFRRAAIGFPKFIKKTDELRIQTLPHILESSHSFIVREKLDGSSMTAFLVRRKSKVPWRKERLEFGLCSRNWRIYRGTKDSDRFFAASDKYKIKEALKQIIGKHEWIAIQGELLGPGIQGNRYALQDVDFWVFNLITPHGRVPCSIGETIVQSQGLKWVPIIGEISMPMSVEHILEFATGKSRLHPATMREGIVCRNYTEGISFKAVSPDYLLKKEGEADSQTDNAREEVTA